MGLLGPSCLTSGGPRLLYLGFEASLQAAFALESPELILLPTKYLQRCGSAALLAVSPALNALCAYFRVGSHPQEEGKKKNNQTKENKHRNPTFYFSFNLYTCCSGCRSRPIAPTLCWSVLGPFAEKQDLLFCFVFPQKIFFLGIFITAVYMFTFEFISE